MDFLVLKVCATPLLIAAATLAARRFGPAVGGWVAGLPLTSGPVSVFLALERGPGFAGAAARGTLLGSLAVAAFCAAYVHAGARERAGRDSWPLGLTCGVAAYLAAAALLAELAPSLAAAVPLALAGIALGLVALGPRRAAAAAPSPPPLDMALRMLAATALVLALTGAAAALGPRWTGLLSPFPVFASVLAVFAQRQLGARAAREVLRGILVGLVSFLAFFAVVILEVERLPLAACYGAASAAALAVHGLGLALLVRRRAGAGPA